MVDSPTTISIGEFSSLSRLSVRMLRYYDNHKVLVPAAVDPLTGYRRYSPAQLRDAADIRRLRDLHFKVSAIPILLTVRGTPAWTNALLLQRSALAAELNAARGRLALIDQMLTEGDHMPITIERITIPAMQVVSLRGTVPTYHDEGQLWEQLIPLIQEQGIALTGPCGVIEHDEEYRENDVDLSIFLPIAADVTVQAPLEVLDLPQRDCLVAHVHGSYDLITVANEMLGEYMVRSGLRRRADGTLSSKVFNHYLNDPNTVPAEELLTDVHWPLAE